MSTLFPSKSGIERRWHLLDADSVALGKVACRAATLLMGKHKTSYTPFLDTGDHVVVINAAKVRLSGNKENDKLYRRFTGYPGGLVAIRAGKMRELHPSRMLEEAIAGMLPKTKLGKQMYRKLRVYAGNKHTHAAQKVAASKV